MENTRNESIITKIKGLLAIANDHKNDQESHSAFLMAQKLMVKYDVEAIDVMDDEIENEVVSENATKYKPLLWWEKDLGIMISNNFRVELFAGHQIEPGKKKGKRCITFMGHKVDVELAIEMYGLAYDTVVFYAKRFVDQYYKQSGISRNATMTSKLKNSYIRGFIAGLNKKFEEQAQSIKEEFGLILLVPQDVKDAFSEFSRELATVSHKRPDVESKEAYHLGYKEGKRVDYTKKTIEA